MLEYLLSFVIAVVAASVIEQASRRHRSPSEFARRPWRNRHLSGGCLPISIGADAARHAQLAVSNDRR